MALDPRMAAVVEQQLHRARSAAWAMFQRMPRAGIELAELEAVALEALAQAADSWISPYCSSRGYSPWRPDDPSRPHPAWEAFSSLRMSGAIKDYLRKLDHVPRQARGRLKQIRDAQLAGARSDDELAEATGLPVVQVRRALQADALKPVSLDGGGSDFSDNVVTDYGELLADSSAEGDTESAVVVNGALAVLVAEFDALDAEVRVILALRYFHEWPLEKIAGEMFTTEERVTELHLAGVDQIHRALLLAVV